MINVVGIRFKAAGKIYYFDPGDLELALNEIAIVETARGVEAGEIVIPNRTVEESEIVAPLKKVIRKANEADLKQIELNRSKEAKAQQVCLEKIREHGLPMKLVDVEYTFDANKIIFYFTADGRIDFRELVKDLAAIFRTRIELRQIGVRDEAKMLGGLGSCGRGLCCATFLGEFEPVSIRMAKDQNLSLNPTKISGICGRLMCCLKYESEAYEEERKLYPDVGTPVETPVGEGKITAINILKRAVTVELKESRQMMDFPMAELKIKGHGKCCRNKNKAAGDNLPPSEDMRKPESEPVEINSEGLVKE